MDYRLFPLIKFRSMKSPGYYYDDDESKFEDQENEVNILPELSDVTQFDFSPFIKDKPTEYQIEAYIACLLENTICYMPSESSKNKNII
jgi:hypothetical protein